MKCAHGILEQCLVYHDVQPCITISLVIRIINRIMFAVICTVTVCIKKGSRTSARYCT
jgi:hypothetical protein